MNAAPGWRGGLSLKPWRAQSGAGTRRTPKLLRGEMYRRFLTADSAQQNGDLCSACNPGGATNPLLDSFSLSFAACGLDDMGSHTLSPL